VILIHPKAFSLEGITGFYWDSVITCWLPVISVDLFQAAFFTYFPGRRFLENSQRFKTHFRIVTTELHLPTDPFENEKRRNYL
jgi:hypothetical protein